MALFDQEKKDGIQLGTVGDECVHCRREGLKKALLEEINYEPKSLDYQPVFKIHVNNMGHCLCMDCFKKLLGNYVLIDPNELEVAEEIIEEPKESKKSSKKSSNKKEDK